MVKCSKKYGKKYGEMKIIMVKNMAMCKKYGKKTID